jgi:MFS family permease
MMPAVDTTPTTPTARDGVWTPARRALTAGLVLTVTLGAFESFAMATVMPRISADLGGISLYGWVFSSFFLANLVGIVWAGRSADHYGPARPLLAGLALFGVGLLAGGVAPAMGWLVAARAVQGLGAGAIVAIAYVAVGRGYPAQLQPRMFAVISTAWVLPALVAPSISGAIATAIGWRWVLLGLLPLVVVAGAATLPSLMRLGAPGGETPVDRRVDALLVAFGAALVLAAASSRSAIVAPPLAIVGVIVGGRAFARIMPRGTLRLAPGLPAAIALRGFITFAFFGTDAFVTLTLTSLRGTSVTLAGIALTAASLTWTVGAWLQARYVERFGPRAFVRVGTVTIACGIGGMIMVAHTAVPLAVAVLAWGVAGLGMGLAYAPISLVVLSSAAPGTEGTATASLQLCETLGVALGTGASGAIVAAGAALGWARDEALTLAFVTGIAFALAAAIGAGRLPTRLTRHSSSS